MTNNDDAGTAQFALAISTSFRRTFWWILCGWLITILSSVLWNLGFRWADWTWIPGLVIFLRGLSELRGLYKRLEASAKQLDEQSTADKGIQNQSESTEI
jgi:hypothetical protein